MGISIKNLMRERERNVEQVVMKILFNEKNLLLLYLDNENHGT